MPVNKIPFGIPGLDEALNGGIPENNLVLISGGAGTGKSTLCLQYLVNGAKKGEKGLYISTEQNLADLSKQGEQYGWNLQELVDKNLLRVVYIDIIREDFVFKKIKDSIQDFKPNRLVIDSLNTLSDFTASTDFARQLYMQRGTMSPTISDKVLPENLTENLLKRKIMMAFLSEIKNTKTTALLTSELPEKGDYLSADGVSEFLSDGVIILNYLGVGLTQFRSIQIRKMRYSNHEKDYIGYDLKAGIEIQKDVV
ncbi:AAA family ATPase [Candidatus Micrarchaeota archaeon]|nr:AAA family ATPase [Candidatus Micrarchaeota archaeon]